MLTDNNNEPEVRSTPARIWAFGKRLSVTSLATTKSKSTKNAAMADTNQMTVTNRAQRIRSSDLLMLKNQYPELAMLPSSSDIQFYNTDNKVTSHCRGVWRIMPYSAVKIVDYSSSKVSNGSGNPPKAGRPIWNHCWLASSIMLRERTASQIHNFDGTKNPRWGFNLPGRHYMAPM